jgi:hypothetical protein
VKLLFCHVFSSLYAYIIKKVENCNFYLTDIFPAGVCGISIESCDGARVSNIEISNIIDQQDGHRKIRFDLTNGDKKANFIVGDGKITYTDEAGKTIEFKDFNDVANNQPELLDKINDSLSEYIKIMLQNSRIDLNENDTNEALRKMFEL